MGKRKKENRQPKGGMGGRHAAKGWEMRLTRREKFLLATRRAVAAEPRSLARRRRPSARSRRRWPWSSQPRVTSTSRCSSSDIAARRSARVQRGVFERCSSEPARRSKSCGGFPRRWAQTTRRGATAGLRWSTSWSMSTSGLASAPEPLASAGCYGQCSSDPRRAARRERRTVDRSAAPSPTAHSRRPTRSRSLSAPSATPCARRAPLRLTRPTQSCRELSSGCTQRRLRRRAARTAASPPA